MALAVVGLALVGMVEAAAGTTTFQPQGMWVEGGEEAWHSKPTFTFHWSNPPGVADVHYRLLDPLGQEALAESTVGWPATTIENLRVPAAPGLYTAEVWLEDATGDTGPVTPAKLRFDDTRPGAVAPLPAPAWIGRNAFPYSLELTHPAGPEPPSGIRGYAVAVDGIADGAPCAEAKTCGEAETDLRGGAGLDTLAIADLPEGTSYAHAVAVSGSGMSSAAVGTEPLRVDKTDPATVLSGVPVGWSDRPVRLQATASDAASGMEPALGGETPFTAIEVDGRPPTTAPGDSVTRTLIESGVHTVAYYARDAAGNVADGGVANGRPNPEPAMATVRIDRDPPRVAFANAQDPTDPELVEALASDGLSGIDGQRGQIAVRRTGSSERFAGLPTAGTGNGLQARWDSDSYPPGTYEFRATAYDRAGNATSSTLRANGSAMTLRNPLKVPTALVAGFVGSGRSGAPSVTAGGAKHDGDGERTVLYGEGAVFGGRLVAGRRAPLSGTPVRVIERFDSGSKAGERSTLAITGRRGGFSVRLAPGPSREVLAVAPPTATLYGSSSRPARLTVLAGLRLRASSRTAEVGGRPIVFSGRVFGREIPGDGKAVQLQFRLPGLPWSEFRTVETDARGRFRYAYRFADDDSRGVRFRFRAFAPTQSGWPYGPAASNPVSVLGR